MNNVWQKPLGVVDIGKSNSGNCNSGDYNIGNCNSGNHNSGNRNSGDWNKTNFSNGCFNTVEPKVYLFNKPSDWTHADWVRSDAKRLLNQISKSVVKWVRSKDMTDKEKAKHPTHKITGGYLKVLGKPKCNQQWWDELSENDKEIIKAIPNFDKVIFEEITGIKVGE